MKEPEKRDKTKRIEMIAGEQVHKGRCGKRDEKSQEMKGREKGEG